MDSSSHRVALEGDNIYELNTYSGAEAASRKLRVEDVEGESKMHAEVAELRHIKLLRQAGLRLKQRHSVCRISKQTAVQFTVDLFPSDPFLLRLLFTGRPTMLLRGCL